MASVQRTVTLPLAFVVCVLVATGVVATPSVAVGESLAVTAPQDSAAGEASLALDRPTRRLIQQGLRNEGFDPGTPDGLFGPRTRAAIREWQHSRGASSTGYLNGAEAELLRTATAPPAAAPDAPPPPEVVPAAGPTASSAAAAPASTPTETDPGPPSPATVAAEEVDPQNAAETNTQQRPRARGADGTVQLPPEILVDLLRAERLLADGDPAAGREALNEILALQEEHAQVAHAAAIASLNEYLAAVLPAASPHSESNVRPGATFDLKPFRDGNKFVFVTLSDEEPTVPDISKECPTGGEKCVASAQTRRDRAKRDLEAYNNRKDRQGLNSIYEAQLAGDVPIWGQQKVRDAADAAERNARTGWTPQVYLTMMVRLRMLHGESNPVPPPSFMPKGTLQLLYFHPVAPSENHTSTTAIDLTLGHHSNGQTDCPFLDQAVNENGKCIPLTPDDVPVADINIKSGNFSTHYLRVRINQRWRSDSWQGTVGGGIELHPSNHRGTEGRLSNALAERYGRTRIWLTGDFGSRHVYFRGWFGGILHGSALRNRLVRRLEAFAYLRSNPDVALYLASRAGQDIYNISFESDVGWPDVAFGATFGWGAALSRSLPSPF